MSNRNINRYFPDKKGVDKKKLLISNVGRFSVSFPKDAKKTAEIIKSYLGKNITITDGTANNGGNTIAFSHMFKKVNSIEIDEKEYQILQNNIKEYKLKNVTTYNDDFVDKINTLKQDVIFLDPPWGGRNYKSKRNLKLFLGRKSLLHVTNDLIDKCEMIVCKVPFNYDFTSLFKYSKFTKNIHVYSFEKYAILILHKKKLTS